MRKINKISMNLKGKHIKRYYVDSFVWQPWQFIKKIRGLLLTDEFARGWTRPLKIHFFTCSLYNNVFINIYQFHQFLEIRKSKKALIFEWYLYIIVCKKSLKPAISIAKLLLATSFFI